MAKQLVGPVERHVEKVGVGVAGLLLIGVIARYLVTSPNQLELGGKTVYPNTIDELVAQKAREVARTIQNAPVKATELQPLREEFAEATDPFERAGISPTLRRAAPFLPEVPIIDPPEAIEGQRNLVQVVRLTAPQTKHGRTMFDEGAGVVRNWVTISARFDRSEQSKRQAVSYGAQWSDVVFGPVQLQRRTLRPDGSWPDEWADVDTFVYSSYRVPEPPVVTLEEGAEAMVAPIDVQKRIAAYLESLNEPLRQLELLRPKMPPRIVGTPWEFPILTSYSDVLAQDDEYLNPDKLERSENLEDRYGLAEEDTQQAATEQLNPTQLIDKELDDADKVLANAKTPEDAIQAHNMYFTVAENPDATPSQVRRAQQGQDAANQKQRDLIRIIRRKGDGEQQATQAEESKERELSQFQQVWAHDAGDGSVKSGKIYQYRMRLQIFNRLAGEPAKFADPEDAKTVLIGGEWSEPTDPAIIEPDNYFFFAGCDKRKNEAKVEFYRWFEGYWVTTREAFGIGDRLKCESRVSIPAADNPEEEDRPDVTFDAGATIVDIDMNRPCRKRDELHGGGVRISSSPDTDYSVVVVDPDGNLSERFTLLDKDNPLRREVGKRVYKHNVSQN